MQKCIKIRTNTCRATTTTCSSIARNVTLLHLDRLIVFLIFLLLLHVFLLLLFLISMFNPHTFSITLD